MKKRKRGIYEYNGRRIEKTWQYICEEDKEPDDSIIYAIENWHSRLTSDNIFFYIMNDRTKYTKKIKYMNPAKEMDRILLTRKTYSSNNNLLIIFWFMRIKLVILQ